MKSPVVGKPLTSPPGLIISRATVVEAHRLARRPVFVDQGRIAASPPPGAWELDLPGHLIFPGLVNAHDHLHLNSIPPLPENEFFGNSYAWITAFQSYLADPTVARACAVPKRMRFWQGALKNLLAGATTVVHHDPWEKIFEHPHFPVRLPHRYGWCHSLGLGGLAPGGPHLRYGPSVTHSFTATPSTHPWFIHLAEGQDTLAAHELAQLDSLGYLQANTVLVHGVGLRDSDIDLIIARRARVIWCPGSNLSLLGVTLNPRRLFKAGCLALGTDSRLSGGRNLLEELHLAAIHSDLSPKELFLLVTEAGSRVAGLPEVGGVNPGQCADLLIVAEEGKDPYSSLIGLERHRLHAIVRNGMPVFADPDLAEWFNICGLRTTRIELDGHPELAASAFLGPRGAASLEPGLEITRP